MPYLVDHETMHLIWELLEWFGNTMIFFLAGVVYGGKAVHYSVTGHDFALLILIYVMLMVLRAATIACLSPFISVIGLKCSLREAIFMSWSGLRGALGLAVFRLEKQTADKFFFFIGGICTLSLLINAHYSVPAGPAVYLVSNNQSVILLFPIMATLLIKTQ
jgi:NhaP-type Na+/H+ or K+/H+ antiporter